MGGERREEKGERREEKGGFYLAMPNRIFYILNCSNKEY
jgi:hypothetical protein